MSYTIVWLSAAGFISIAIMRVVDPLLPIVAGDFGLSIGQAGFIASAFALPYGVCQIVYGPVGDRMGKLRVITVMLGVSAIFTAGSALAPSAQALASLRFMTGLTLAAVVPLSLAHIADNVPYAGRQATIARYLSGLICGQIVGGSLGGAFAEFFGWRTIFVVFGLTSGVVSIGLWRATREQRERHERGGASGMAMLRPYLTLLRAPMPRAVIVAVALQGFFFFGGFVYIGAYMSTQFGLSVLYIGLVLSGYGIGALCYSAAVRHVVGALGERGMIVTGSLVTAVCLCLLGAAGHWLWVLPLLIIVGFNYFMMHNTMQTVATELAPQARGTAISLFAFTFFAGQALGVAALGKIIDALGYGIAFATAGAGLALASLWVQSRITFTAGPIDNADVAL